MKVKSESEVAQSCLTLLDPMDCSLPGSSTHWIFGKSTGVGCHCLLRQMWGLDHKEGWVLKNWCFQTVVLDETVESPWTARRSNQSILKEINPEYSLEGLMLKLKLQYSSHLMGRADSLEKTLMLVEITGKRRREKMRWLDNISDSMDMNLSKLLEIVEDKRARHAAVLGAAKSQTWLSNWTATTKIRLKGNKSIRRYHHSDINSWEFGETLRSTLDFCSLQIEDQFPLDFKELEDLSYH